MLLPRLLRARRAATWHPSGTPSRGHTSGAHLEPWGEADGEAVAEGARLERSDLADEPHAAVRGTLALELDWLGGLKRLIPRLTRSVMQECTLNDGGKFKEADNDNFAKVD